MARTTEEIWSSEPSRPQASESDSATSGRAEPVKAEPKADEGGKPEPVKAKPQEPRTPSQQAKPASEAPRVEKHDEPEDDEPTPDDLAGLKKALAAARGDKRTARKKWQDAERALAEHAGELRAMRAHLERLQTPQAKPEQPKPPSPEDEESAYFGNPWGRTKQEIAAAKEEIKRELFAQRLETQEMLARQRYADYDEKIEALKAAVGKNPAIWAQIQNAPDVAEAAYRAGKNLTLVGGDPVTGDIEALKAKWRSEWEAEQQAQREPEPVQQTAKPSLPPKSIAAARGVSVSAKPAWRGPRSMNEIWGSGSASR